jgi:hypothetical protein
MTLTEIRDMFIPRYEPTNTGREMERTKLFILREIAAQLAQLNEGLQYLTEDSRPFQVQIVPGQYPIFVEKVVR